LTLKRCAQPDTAAEVSPCPSQDGGVLAPSGLVDTLFKSSNVLNKAFLLQKIEQNSVN